jgi:hypothetical protein
MIDAAKIALIIAERVREVATRQDTVPFLTGDLRKSIIVAKTGPGRATISSNLPYARAVHDGRPAVTIRPKRKKALFWKGAAHPVKLVKQPARKGRPFLMEAAAEVAADLGFLRKFVGESVLSEIRQDLKLI